MNSDFEEFKASRSLIRESFLFAVLFLVLLIARIIEGGKLFLIILSFILCLAMSLTFIWRLKTHYIKMSDEKMILLRAPLYREIIMWDQIKSANWYDHASVELERHHKRNITIPFKDIDNRQKEAFIKSLRQHLMLAKVEEINTKM